MSLSKPTRYSRLSLVTGANKGLGYEIVRLLAYSNPNMLIILCSRSPNLGETAISELNLSNVSLLILDMSSNTSITAAVTKLRADILPLIDSNTIDYIYHNAGLMENKPHYLLQKQVYQTNLFGIKQFNDLILPILKPSSKIINISSELGYWAYYIFPKHFQTQLENIATLNWNIIENQANYFIEGLNNNPTHKHVRTIYPMGSLFHYGYANSKCLLNGYTQLLARDYPNLIICSINPGLCSTDMTHNHKRLKSAESGAAIIVKTATNIQLNQSGSIINDNGAILTRTTGKRLLVSTVTGVYRAYNNNFIFYSVLAATIGCIYYYFSSKLLSKFK